MHFANYIKQIKLPAIGKMKKKMKENNFFRSQNYTQFVREKLVQNDIGDSVLFLRPL